LGRGPASEGPGRPPVTGEQRDALAQRQANAAVALLRLGRPERVWPLFRHTTYPDLRTHLVHRTGPLGADVRLLLGRLGAEQDPSARQALILALGEFRTEQLPVGLRAAWTARLLRWYREDPDPGLHAAVDWLLRHGTDGPLDRKHDWGQAARLRQIDAELGGRDGVGRIRVALGGAFASALPGPLAALSPLHVPPREAVRPAGRPRW